MLTLLQIILAPVVLISACGLLCLALYNRLASIVSRARAFHRERFDVQTHLARLGDDADATLAAQLGSRIDILTDQTGQVLARAKQIRNALVCMLLTITCMLACSLLLASLSLFGEPVQNAATLAFFASGPFYLVVIAAGVVFLVGIALMIAAMVLAILELRRALDPVQVEHHELAELEQSEI
ncbi:MAG: DUF2721 domain-containing protein [Candidatus Sumerlaeia bacterium]